MFVGILLPALLGLVDCVYGGRGDEDGEDREGEHGDSW